MNETYVECMVARKTPAYLIAAKVGLWVLTVLAALGMFATGMIILFFAAVIFGVVAYFVSVNVDVEYEYLYLDKEISVDKIKGKAKRKRIATYEVEKMEILAPINSYHLDNYKNRQAKVNDYSSGEANQPDKRYVFFYNGQEKVILEPSEDLVKAVKNVAPRKVFSD